MAYEVALLERTRLCYPLQLLAPGICPRQRQQAPSSDHEHIAVFGADNLSNGSSGSSGCRSRHPLSAVLDMAGVLALALDVALSPGPSGTPKAPLSSHLSSS